jgi:hypothetical protein
MPTTSINRWLREKQKRNPYLFALALITLATLPLWISLIKGNYQYALLLITTQLTLGMQAILFRPLIKIIDKVADKFESSNGKAALRITLGLAILGSIWILTFSGFLYAAGIIAKNL